MGATEPSRSGTRDAVDVAERRKLHAVSDRAGRHWGVLRRADLVELGLRPRAIDRWCVIGRLHRLHRGVYALLPAPALTQEGRDLAAVWAVGDAAVLSGVSAAVRWGMLRYAPARPQVLVRSTGHRPLRGIDLRTTRELPPSDRTTRDRIPITTPERTILDLAALRTVSTRALESAAAQAERDGLFHRPAQLRTAARARHRVGAERLRTILRVGPRLWRSDEEAKLSAAVVAVGLPEPVIAYEATTDIGVIEVDLSFPDHRLIVEVDGGQHDLTLNAARDVDRDAALARAGWRTVRIAARTVREDEAAAVRAVAVALRA